MVPRRRCKSERTGQEKIHNRVHTDCLLALLAAYPACLQLRDKAMKVSDTRGFGCRTWRLSPIMQDIFARRHVCYVPYQQLYSTLFSFFYPLRFMLLRLEPSATFTAYKVISTKSWDKLRGRQHSCARVGGRKGGRKAWSQGRCNSLHQVLSAPSHAQRSSHEFFPLPLSPSAI